MSEHQTSQNHHLIRITAPPCDNTLTVTNLCGDERLSQGFRYNLEVNSLSPDPALSQKLIGSEITLGLYQADTPTRFISGIIKESSDLGFRRAGQARVLTLTLVSWLEYALSDRLNCCIFQEVNAAELFEQLLSPYASLAQYTYQASPTPKRTFTAQYNECDLNFFNRICSEEGLAYYFSHNAKGHRLHIIDTDTPLEHRAALVHHSGTASYAHLSHWQQHFSYKPSHYEQVSYSYTRPNQTVSAQHHLTANAGLNTPTKPSVYRYTERLPSPQEAARYTQNFARESTQATQLWLGTGNYSDLQLGQQFQILSPDGRSHPDKNRRFTLSQLSLEASNEPSTLSCQLQAIPDGSLLFATYSPTRIPGLQTAIVQGPTGEEVYADALGRIKVHFHWDRQHRPGEHSSCWLRVMQGVCGNGFGLQFTPRVGQEVVVAFENGNPDRPFVLGSLYHAEHLPPYAEQHSTRSGLKTRSTKHAPAHEGNELSFEDKRGAEQVTLKAQKNYVLRINNDEHHQVGRHRVEETGDTATHRAGKHLRIEAGSQISLHVGSSTIELSQGKIKISGATVEINGNIKLN